MNCKKVQDLLLADYLDGELTAAPQAEIKKHIDGCVRCQQFEQAILETRVPFKHAPRLQPPDDTWQRIRDSVTRRSVNNPFARFAHAVRVMTESRKPAFALATVMAVILIAAVMIQSGSDLSLREMNGQEEIGVLSYLTGEEGSAGDADGAWFQTTIEKYFL